MSDPQHGTNVPKDNGVEYTPNDGFCGVDSFEYTVADMDGVADENGMVSDTATVTIKVICPDENAVEPPVVSLNDDSIETPVNTAVSIPVLDNDVVPTGEYLLLSCCRIFFIEHSSDILYYCQNHRERLLNPCMEVVVSKELPSSTLPTLTIVDQMSLHIPLLMLQRYILIRPQSL